MNDATKDKLIIVALALGMAVCGTLAIYGIAVILLRAIGY